MHKSMCYINLRAHDRLRIAGKIKYRTSWRMYVKRSITDKAKFRTSWRVYVKHKMAYKIRYFMN